MLHFVNDDKISSGLGGISLCETGQGLQTAVLTGSLFFKVCIFLIFPIFFDYFKIMFQLNLASVGFFVVTYTTGHQKQTIRNFYCMHSLCKLTTINIPGTLQPSGTKMFPTKVQIFVEISFLRPQLQITDLICHFIRIKYFSVIKFL